MLPDLTSVPIHDREGCMEMLDGDEELFQELVQLYSENTSQHIQKLEEAVVSGDRDTLATSAHSIKGSSANLCIERVCRLASELEQCAKTDGLELSPFVAAIKVEFNAFLQDVTVT